MNSYGYLVLIKTWYFAYIAGKRDPILNVRNLNFIVDGERIVGIDIEGDAVMRKS